MGKRALKQEEEGVFEKEEENNIVRHKLCPFSKSFSDP